MLRPKMVYTKIPMLPFKKKKLRLSSSQRSRCYHYKKKKYTSSVVYEKWSGLRRLNFGAHKASGQYERVANLCEVEVRGRM